MRGLKASGFLVAILSFCSGAVSITSSDGDASQGTGGYVSRFLKETTLPTSGLYDAVLNASPGDVLYLTLGTFSGSVVAVNKKLSIICKSWTATSKCTIDGKSSRKALEITASSPSTVYLEGLLATNAKTTSYGAAMNVFSGGSGQSVNVQSCVFTLSATGYGTVNLSDGATVTLTNCAITDNTASGYGAGIYMQSSTVTINNCLISNNSMNNANLGGGGIFASVFTDCKIYATTFTGNVATVTGKGGDIYTNGGNVEIVAHCPAGYDNGSLGPRDAALATYGGGVKPTVAYSYPYQSCVACIAGKYSAVTTAGGCVVCPENTYAASAAKGSCDSCPAGTVIADDGVLASEHDELGDCKAVPATTAPTSGPSRAPTVRPTLEPSKKPTTRPTLAPTLNPTNVGDTKGPTKSPTHMPSSAPTAPLPDPDDDGGDEKHMPDDKLILIVVGSIVIIILVACCCFGFLCGWRCRELCFGAGKRRDSEEQKQEEEEGSTSRDVPNPLVASIVPFTGPMPSAPPFQEDKKAFAVTS